MTTMREYLAIPAVSGGVINAMVRDCPRAALHESWLNQNRVREDTDQTDKGTIAHSIFLEGDRSGIVVIDPAEHPAEKGGGIPIGWTNKSIRAARDAARADGKIPVLKDAIEEIDSIVQATRDFVESLKLHEPAIYKMFQDGEGESETTLTWDDYGTACKMRPDRISANRDVIVNYKTTATSAHPERWGRGPLLDYYVPAAFYARGIRHLHDVEPAYLFLVQEVSPPYLCSLIGIGPEMMAIGLEKVEMGLQTWRRCMESRVWPAYPARAVYPEMPPWEAARWDDQQISDGIAYGSQP